LIVFHRLYVCQQGFLCEGKPNQLIDKLKIKNYFGGDSTKGEKINLYMNKGMKQIYDKQMFDIMSNMTNFG
jgi:hypothetical protein